MISILDSKWIKERMSTDFEVEKELYELIFLQSGCRHGEWMDICAVALCVPYGFFLNLGFMLLVISGAHACFFPGRQDYTVINIDSLHTMYLDPN